MTSIYRNTKKLAAQRVQHIYSIEGYLYSPETAARISRNYTAAEIRADRIRAEKWEEDHAAWINAGRRTHRPIKTGSLMWIERKTPDRSIRHG